MPELRDPGADGARLGSAADLPARPAPRTRHRGDVT